MVSDCVPNTLQIQRLWTWCTSWMRHGILILIQKKTWASLPICIIPHRNQGLLVRKLNSPNSIRCNLAFTFSAWTSGSIHAINFALFMLDINKGIYERKKLMLRIFIITKLFFFCVCVVFFFKDKTNSFSHNKFSRNKKPRHILILG